MNETIKETLKERKDFIGKMIKEIENRLKTAPAGMIKVCYSNGHPQYYYRNSGPENEKRYISVKERQLAARLAQKSYDQKILKALQKEQKAILAFLRLYPANPAEEIYAHMAEARKVLVTPILETEEEFRKRWESVEYTGKGFAPEYPEFLTDKGERVRSKSEVLIANALKSMDIPYRYEYPMNLAGAGVVYPDFTALNVRTRTEVIWEHQGMMDDSEYADKAVRKILLYHANGYFEGKNLIVTSETRYNPLNVREIRTIAEAYCR